MFLEFMIFIVGQGGVVYLCYLWVLCQLFGDVQVVFMMLMQVYVQGVQVVVGYIGSIGVQYLFYQVGIFMQLWLVVCVCYCGVYYGVGMVDQVFGVCLNGNINVKIQGFKQDFCCSGVIDYDNCFWGDLMYGGDYCWYIVYFYGD